MQSTISTSASTLKEQYEQQVIALKKEVMLHATDAQNKTQELEEGFKVAIATAMKKEKEKLGLDSVELKSMREQNEILRKRTEELEKLLAAMQGIDDGINYNIGDSGSVEIHLIPTPKPFDLKYNLYEDRKKTRNIKHK